MGAEVKEDVAVELHLAHGIVVLATKRLVLTPGGR